MKKLFAIAMLACATCFAHNGPPFPIINGKTMSGVSIALWTHPDVGIGTFFVVVTPLQGHPIPAHLQFTIGVQPVTGRLEEARFKTERGDNSGDIRYNAAIPFDKQEMWRINLYSSSDAGADEATATVEVTPPGLGKWDLLFFSSPFLGIGALFFLGMRKRRAANRPRV